MSKIKAGTTSTTAYQVEADTTGTLVLQTGATPTTALTIGTNQVVTFAQAPSLPAASIPQAALAAGVSGNGPAFYAATSVSKTVSNATATEIAGYNAALFDTASCFNTTTGRFTPTVAGYYQVSASADFGSNGIGACSIVSASIYKNGSAYFSSGTAVTGSSFGSYSPSTVVYLNGTTDYVSVFVFQNTGLTSNQFFVRFGAAMVRAA